MRVALLKQFIILYLKEGEAMESSERRELIFEAISKSETPLSASALARQFHVSRQIIVGDVALLRASGKQIMATPRGYICDIETTDIVRTIAVSHKVEELEDEIITIVDLGGQLLDVIVDHPIYGELVGNLHIASRYDAAQFFEKLEKHKAVPLSRLTNGLHLHTISCKDEACFKRIIQALETKGYLWKS